MVELNEEDKALIRFIKYTLIPDLNESEQTETANDFSELLKIIDKLNKAK